MIHLDIDAWWHSTLPWNEAWKTPKHKKQVQMSLAVMRTDQQPSSVYGSLNCGDFSALTDRCNSRLAKACGSERLKEWGRNTTDSQREWQREKKEVMEREKEEEKERNWDEKKVFRVTGQQRKIETGGETLTGRDTVEMTKSTSRIFFCPKRYGDKFDNGRAAGVGLNTIFLFSLLNFF